MARQIPFKGDDPAYIRFLEERVLQLEDSLRYPCQQCTYVRPSPKSQADLNEVRTQDEILEIHHSDRSQIEAATQNQNHDGRSQFGLKNPNGQRHRRRIGGDSEDETIEIIEYNTNAHSHSRGTNKSTLTQSKKQQFKTLSIFSKFLDDLPQSNTWKNWVLALDGIQRREMLRSLVQDCGTGASMFSSLEAHKSLTDVSSESTSISILSDYAASIVLIGKGNRQLACFREMIFVSLCAVALETFERKDSVYEAMRRVLGSDADSKQLLKLVRGAKWANSLISLLSETKWASRSWDILCVGMVGVVISFSQADSTKLSIPLAFTPGSTTLPSSPGRH
jgi:hypothetical protein